MDPAQDHLPVLATRPSPDVLCRELAGESVLLDLKSQRYYGLDPVGTRIWQLIREGGQTDAVLQAMLEEFEVPAAQLEQDLSEFLHELAAAVLIELERADPPPAEPPPCT